jgi:hypothetical protein
VIICAVCFGAVQAVATAEVSVAACAADLRRIRTRDAESRADAGVPEDRLRIAGSDTQVLEQRGGSRIGPELRSGRTSPARDDLLGSRSRVRPRPAGIACGPVAGATAVAVQLLLGPGPAPGVATPVADNAVPQGSRYHSTARRRSRLRDSAFLAVLHIPVDM